ncbi:hypothetical protein [Streptomyces sp. NBC_00140]|nr:hypothetical protein [Streptomyces sp. NBC_00140]MCX5329132.1 hypothetical protein [Streptomyces sp. NBC_00140]
MRSLDEDTAGLAIDELGDVIRALVLELTGATHVPDRAVALRR